MNFLDLVSLYQPKNNEAMQAGMQQGEKLGEAIQPGLQQLMNRWKMDKQSKAVQSYLAPQPVPRAMPVSF